MASEPTIAIPSVGEPTLHNDPKDFATTPTSSIAESSASVSEDDIHHHGTHASSRRNSTRLIPRPKLGSRKSSGTMIVASDVPNMVVDNELDEDDVRSMSPRRSSAELDRLGEAARRDMIEQARVLQTSLQAIVDRVETVKSEHEKLEGGNKFLQSYIGELMQTSRITSTSMSKKGKGRSGK